MLSLFHNIINNHSGATNREECELVKVIDLMDLLEKVNQKAKYPEQQQQQQQIIEQLEKNWDIRNIIQNNIELYDKIIKELESHNYVNYDPRQLHPEITENEVDNIIAIHYYLENQKNSRRNDKDFNEVYSLFNSIKSSVKEEDIEMYNKIEIYEITNTVKAIVESVRKKQQPQQGRTQNQNVLPQQQNIQGTQNTNKKLKSEYNAVSGASDTIQQELSTVQQQQNRQTDSLDNVDANNNYYNSTSCSDCFTNVDFELSNLNINDVKDNQTINQGQIQIN